MDKSGIKYLNSTSQQTSRYEKLLPELKCPFCGKILLINSLMAEIFLARSKKTESKIRGMMKQKIWLTDKEAKEAGLLIFFINKRRNDDRS